MTFPIAPRHHQFYRDISADTIERLEIPKPNESLSKDKIDLISSEFESFTRDLHYNALAPALELAAWMGKNPSMSPKEAFLSFSLSPSSSIEKYHGAPPSMIVAAFAEKMDEMGYVVEMMGKFNPLSHRFDYPIPGSNTLKSPMIWSQAKEYLHGVTHHFLVFKYSDSQNKPSILALKKYFSENEISSEHYQDSQSFQNSQQCFTDHPLQQITDPLDPIKSMLQIRFRYFIFHKDSGATLIVNLLDGKLSMDSVPGLVHNLDKKVEFDLIDLMKHPEENVGVFINDTRDNFKKKDLLDLLLTQVGNHFDLPSDFNQNVKKLMKYRRKIINEIMLPPAKLIFDTWEIYQEADLIRQQAHFASRKGRTGQAKKPVTEGEQLFMKAVTHLYAGHKHRSKKYFDQATTIFNACIDSCCSAQAVPRSLVLEGFKYM